MNTIYLFCFIVETFFNKISVPKIAFGLIIDFLIFYNCSGFIDRLVTKHLFKYMSETKIVKLSIRNTKNFKSLSKPVRSEINTTLHFP